MVKTGEWETVNKANAIWSARQEGHQPGTVRRVLQADQPRLRGAAGATRHNRVEGSTEYTQLLYLPAQGAAWTCGTATRAAGVKLYVKRVFIMDDAEALMPDLPALRQGRGGLGRPAAEREPRTAAGKPRRQGHPRGLHQARAGHAGRPGPRHDEAAGEPLPTQTA
jgi:hypothetical protein